MLQHSFFIAILLFVQSRSIIGYSIVIRGTRCNAGAVLSREMTARHLNRRTSQLTLPLFSAASDDNEEEDESALVLNKDLSSTNFIGETSNCNSSHQQDSSRFELESTDTTKNNASQTIKSTLSSNPITLFFQSLKSFNKESISKLGMSALLAYGFVSNVSGVLAVSSAWFIFSKRVSHCWKLENFECWKCPSDICSVCWAIELIPCWQRVFIKCSVLCWQLTYFISTCYFDPNCN